VAKNPNAKATKKKKLAEQQRAKNEQLYVQRAAAAKAKGNNAKKPKGMAMTPKQMEQASSRDLEMIVDKRLSGHQIAGQILEQRRQQATNSRTRQRELQQTVGAGI